MNSQFNLLAAQRLLRTNLRLFLVFFCIVALAICVATRPRLPSLKDSAQSPYISFASLVLPANTRFAMKSVFASTGQSDLDFWITDSTLFEKLVERLRIKEKISAELRKKDPELARFGTTVSITALRTGVRPAVTPGDSRETASVADKYGVAPETLENAPKNAEVQYAQLDTGEDDDWEFHQNRLNRIAIRGAALRAADSKLVVDVAVRILRTELEALAVRRAQKRRKTIEGFIASGNRRLNRLYRKLGKQAAADPQQAARIMTQQNQLSKNKLKANADLAALKGELARVIVSEPITSDDTDTSKTVQTAERELRQAEVIFLPSSFTVVRMRERLTSLRAFAARLHSEHSRQLAVGLRARIEQKEAEIAKYQAEMNGLKRRLPDPKQVVSYRQLERELATWDAQLLAWEQQLLQARIEERLCRGDGTVVILQGALPGIRPPVVTQQLFTQYRKTLTMLPLAPLAALAGVLIVRLVQGARQIRSRAEYYFDAPVLGELPKLPRAYRKNWNYLKVQGRSLPAEKGSS